MGLELEQSTWQDDYQQFELKQALAQQFNISVHNVNLENLSPEQQRFAFDYLHAMDADDVTDEYTTALSM